MRRRLSACLFLAAILAVPATAGAQQPADARVVPLQVTGDPQARFSMVILGDGYTAAELPKFRADVERHLNILWSIEPFRSYRSYFNVYRVDVVSAESGVTCDPAHREQRNTALGLHYDGGCENPNARGVLVGRDTAAREFAARATPHYNQVLIIANTDTYGGIGGSLATTTAGNAISPLITPHELGHSLGRLQDEYTYRERGVRGPFYTNEEPQSVQHTLLTEAQMREQQRKWWRWLGEESEAGGVIGRYEGGLYSAGGVWRPSRHSMMISLGYYFDQVSRERMVARIATFSQLIAAGTPEGTVARDQVVWVETPVPVSHDLDITWQVDGRPVESARGARQLDLESLAPAPGATVTVRVVDPTPFVRDPVIRDSLLTAVRTWRVGDARVGPQPARAAFTSSTDTARAIGGADVVYANTTQPGDRVLELRWRLDGRALDVPPQARTVDLGALRLPAGTHVLEAALHDPAAPQAPQAVLRWRVDNTAPTVTYELSQPAAVHTRPDGVQHYYMRDAFTMKLVPADDQAGHVVAEFRVNGDGWHHYYGWPDAPPGTPYRFTPRGTVIKELVYGSLSAEGLSPQPWETRAPGWGTHRIEVRAIDAAGNIGAPREFHVTLMPAPQCDRTITGRHAGDLVVDAGVTCVRDAEVRGSVRVAPGASLFAERATVTGDVDATGAAVVELLEGRVQGSVRLVATRTAPALFGTRVAGTVTF